jgi:hypothetical protein
LKGISKIEFADLVINVCEEEKQIKKDSHTHRLCHLLWLEMQGGGKQVWLDFTFVLVEFEALMRCLK